MRERDRRWSKLMKLKATAAAPSAQPILRPARQGAAETNRRRYVSRRRNGSSDEFGGSDLNDELSVEQLAIMIEVLMRMKEFQRFCKVRGLSLLKARSRRDWPAGLVPQETRGTLGDRLETVRMLPALVGHGLSAAG